MPTAPIDRLAGNHRRVADLLRHRGPATRAELISATGLSRATISAVLTDLTTDGLLTQPRADRPHPADLGDTQPPGSAGDPIGSAGDPIAAAGDRGRTSGRTGGRPASLVQLSTACGLVVGVDVGRSHLRVALADLGHTILDQCAERLAPGTEIHAGAVLDRVAALIDQLLTANGHRLDDVRGVCLGLPAPIVGPRGRVGSSQILPGWGELAPADELLTRLGVPVRAENDANLGALSESLWGAAKTSEIVMYVKLGTGIGAGLVFDGKPFRGVTGTAGELGHLSQDFDGEVCRCGNRGCLELVASGAALVEAVRGTRPEITDLSDLVRLAIDGDAACRRLVADAGSHVGVALGGMVNLLNPDRIVVGGELAHCAELLLEPLRVAVARSAVPSAVASVTVTRGVLAEQAEVLGALALALREPDRLLTPPSAA